MQTNLPSHDALILFFNLIACRQSSKGSPEKEKLVEVTGPLGAGTWNPSPSTWNLGSGAALVVHFGLFEVVGDLRRVQPSVYHDPDHSVVCVFQG